MKNRSRKQSTNQLLPLALILAGVVLALGLLIWQLARQQTSPTGQNPAQSANTGPYPEIERVSLAEAKQAFDQEQAVFLDVRAADSYQAGHIPGALNIPEDDLGSRLSELDPADWILTYCT